MKETLPGLAKNEIRKVKLESKSKSQLAELLSKSDFKSRSEIMKLHNVKESFSRKLMMYHKHGKSILEVNKSKGQSYLDSTANVEFIARLKQEVMTNPKLDDKNWINSTKKKIASLMANEIQFKGLKSSQFASYKLRIFNSLIEGCDNNNNEVVSLIDNNDSVNNDSDNDKDEKISVESFNASLLLDCDNNNNNEVDSSVDNNDSVNNDSDNDKDEHISVKSFNAPLSLGLRPTFLSFDIDDPDLIDTKYDPDNMLNIHSFPSETPSLSSRVFSDPLQTTSSSEDYLTKEVTLEDDGLFIGKQSYRIYKKLNDFEGNYSITEISEYDPYNIKGINNTKFLCHIISLIQIFYHNASIRLVITSSIYVKLSAGCLLQQIFQLLSKDNKKKWISSKTVTSLVIMLGLDAEEQQDASETFLLLVDKVDENLIEGLKLHNIFSVNVHRKLVQCYTPDCQYDFNRNENNIYVSAEISIRENDYSHLLDFAQPAIEAVRTEHGPNIHHTSELSKTFTSFNQVLGFFISRTYYIDNDEIIKLKQIIDFEYNFKVIKNINGVRLVLNYSLSSIIMHHGESYTSGHYTSYIKIDGVWHHFNDKEVQKVENIDKVQLSGKGNTSTCFFFYDLLNKDSLPLTPLV